MPEDGASDYVIRYFDTKEVCVTADFSKKYKETDDLNEYPLISVKSSHYIFEKDECKCGTIQRKETPENNNGIQYNFVTESGTYAVEAGDAAVLDNLNRRLETNICFKAYFRSEAEETRLESSANIDCTP